MKDNNYIVIQAFMRNELDLKGNELIIYAVIYGFSQDGVHPFRGTRAYLADCAGISKSAVSNILRSLTEKGYIDRSERINEYGNIMVEYRANLTIIGGTKKSTTQSYSEPPIINTGRGMTKNDSTPLSKIGSNDKANIDILKDNPKENIDWLQVEGESMEYAFAYRCIAAWQTMTGKQSEQLSPRTMDYLQSQKENYTIDEVRDMIEYKRNEWSGTKFEKILYPKTLFNPENFVRYMNQSKDAKAVDDRYAFLDREPDFVFDE